jgi:hypothetical protein
MSVIYKINDEAKSIVFRLPIQLMKTQSCVRICEKNFPKSAKTGKNRRKRGKLYYTNSFAYNNLRRLGNSEVLSSNP